MAAWAMASTAVPTWGAAGVTSTAGGASVGLVASLLFLPGLPASLGLAQGSKVVEAIAREALLTFGITLTTRMGVPTLVTAELGHGVYVEGRCGSGN